MTNYVGIAARTGREGPRCAQDAASPQPGYVEKEYSSTTGSITVKTISIAAVALAGALSLAACSSSSDDTAAAPAASTSAAAGDSMAASAEPMAAGDIIDIASTTDGFATLTAAVTAGGLVETLKGAGPFTVFAPTDAAFAALPAGVLDALLLPENKDALAKILTYHVVAGKVMAADVTDGDVATVEGQNVTLSTADGVTVNGAKVVQADVVTSNGVIHAIDAVILPPDVDVAALLAK
ncbi:MAG: fasciclin domain-containing protein [Actinobacteria bacterium]|nr:fasciclin domain-containing protein [Actinomycetota bacterium]